MANAEFVDLLAKYGMTFFWGALNKKWWIIGQVEHGCAQNSVPEPAENFTIAQSAALQYIQRKYKLISLAN